MKLITGMAKAAPSFLSELICLRLHLLPLGASQASADCAGLVRVTVGGLSSEMVPRDGNSNKPVRRGKATGENQPDEGDIL